MRIAAARNTVADFYDRAFASSPNIIIPVRTHSNHVFHQYTMRIQNINRDKLREQLAVREIPSMVYYPIPLHMQKLLPANAISRDFPVTENLCQTVLFFANAHRAGYRDFTILQATFWNQALSEMLTATNSTICFWGWWAHQNKTVLAKHKKILENIIVEDPAYVKAYNHLAGFTKQSWRTLKGPDNITARQLRLIPDTMRYIIIMPLYCQRLRNGASLRLCWTTHWKCRTSIFPPFTTSLALCMKCAKIW